MTTKAAVQLYGTRIPIDGWSGLPLLALGVAIVLALPEAAAIILTGILGGTLMSLWLIRRHGA